MAHKIVIITIPENNEGRGTERIVLVNSPNIDTVRKAMEGTGVGVMDSDLEYGHFKSVEVLSLPELAKKFPKKR